MPPRAFLEGLRTLTLTLLTCFSLPLIAGCAPDRSHDDDDDGTPDSSFSDTLFTVIDSGAEQDSLQGRLVLVDTNVHCDELNWGGSLAWWELASDVEFIELYLTLGTSLTGWTREFQSFYSWQQEGTFDYANAAFFSGQRGTGNSSPGDDDDDIPEPPPPIDGREVTDQFADSEETQSDSLSISSYNLEGTVNGYLQSSVGNYSFSATHCGVVNDVPIGGGSDPGDVPTPG